jgi:hypothetical protein
MRHSAIVLVILLVATGAAQASAVKGPHLAVTKQSPFVVHGSGFKSGERVTVLLDASQTWTRRAVADASGAFVVRFGVDLQSCDSFSVHAFGSRGSRARTLPTPRTACSAPTG